MPGKPMRTAAQKRKKISAKISFGWLTDWYKYRTPYEGGHTGDALFYTFARRVRWMETPERMQWFNRRAVIWCMAVPLVLMTLVALVVMAIGEPDNLVPLLWIFVGISLPLGFVVDFFCLFYAVEQVRFVRREQIADLLRMSTIFPSWLVESRYHLALLYAWRGVLMLLMFRAAVMVAVVLCAIGIVGFALFDQTVDRVQIGMIMGYVTGGAIFVGRFLLREPYWRYIAMVRIGTAVAVYRETALSTWVYIIVRLTAFWGLQLIFVMGWWFVAILLYALGAALWYGMEAIAPFPGDVLVSFVLSMVITAFPTIYLSVFRSSQLEFINDLGFHSHRVFGHVD